VSIDYAKKRGAVVRRGDRLHLVREAIAKVRAGESVDLSGLKADDLMKVEPLQVDDRDQLRAEQESFVQAVRTRSRPLVTAEDGAAAVELATRIVESIRPVTL
jgi:predicted dehydrogenase